VDGEEKALGCLANNREFGIISQPIVSMSTLASVMEGQSKFLRHGK
jgi:hypothetical protein